MMLNVPLSIATDNSVSRSGISYAVSCAADLIPPINVYLLLDDQPAKKTPIGAIPKMAIAYKIDKSGFVAYIPLDNGIIPRINSVDETIKNGDTSKINLSARCGTMCSLTRNFIPSATFWKKPGKIEYPIQERLFTLSTVANFSSRLPNLLFSHLFNPPIGFPNPNGSIFHQSPAVTPFSPTHKERSAVVAPRLSFILATAFRSIHRIANWEKNSIRNTIFTTANVAAPNAIAPELSSRGVPSNRDGIRSSKVVKINSLKSYLSSMVSPQRSVSPIQGSKLPMIAGMSATL